MKALLDGKQQHHPLQIRPGEQERLALLSPYVRSQIMSITDPVRRMEVEQALIAAEQEQPENTVKSGSTVPLKFQVFAGSIELKDTSVVITLLKVTKVNCVGGEEIPIETTATGGTSLRYDTTASQFIYNWQTPSGQAGACYDVTVTTTDGSSIVAHFKLK